MSSAATVTICNLVSSLKCNWQLGEKCQYLLVVDFKPNTASMDLIPDTHLKCQAECFKTPTKGRVFHRTIRFILL